MSHLMSITIPLRSLQLNPLGGLMSYLLQLLVICSWDPVVSFIKRFYLQEELIKFLQQIFNCGLQYFSFLTILRITIASKSGKVQTQTKKLFLRCSLVGENSCLCYLILEQLKFKQEKKLYVNLIFMVSLIQ